MRRFIIILVAIPLLAFGDTPDSTKVDSVKRSYIHVQKKMSEQNVRLDSIIMMLRNDTINKRL